MKKLIITITVIIFASFASAQDFNPQKLPKEVKKSFDQKYGNAENAIWTLKNESVYYVNFVLKSKIHTASFNQLGAWLETRIKLNDSDLPTAVMNSVKKNYNTSIIKEIIKIEKPDNIVVFEITLAKDENITIVNMNKNGEITK